jgi:L-2-hydroxyglutarate oxidase LhgO
MVASAATKVEAVVIGAGVVGLAVARSLSAAGREVLLLDRAGTIGSETSSRNSEVVHGGLYYPSQSYKARFCVRGRELLYQFCQERSVTAKRCGKLIVAKESQQKQLKALHEKALENGVADVQLLSCEQVRDIEPNVDAPGGALWSPSTGIVDSHSFMVSLLADAEHNGTTLALRSSVDDGELDHGIRILAGDMWLSCDVVVNCAGLWADEIAAKLHRNHSWQPPTQYYCKGNYFRLQGQKSPFSRLIYPLPDERGGLGVHATVDAAGQIKFGPDVEWLDLNTRPDTIDWTVNPRRTDSFYDSIRTYWSDLEDDALVPDYSGVRPKLTHPALLDSTTSSVPFSDFILAGPETHGVPGLVHMFGIESPGLTCAMALAEYVTQCIRVPRSSQ